MLFRPPTQRKQEQRLHVIESWWQRLGAPGLVCLAIGKHMSGFFRQETVDVEGFIHANDDEHLFFCPHTFAPLNPEMDGFAAALVKNHGNRLGRIKECSLPCRGLWADLDAVDPSKLGALEPTIAWETSPQRYQGLWLTDEVVTDISLNKRLTYHVGADKGGWCFTKLLRLPGSRNQKYKPAPRVRVLWDDGPVHRLAELERVLPPLAQAPEPRAHAALPTRGGGGGGIISGDNAQRILDQYGIRGWLRGELLDGGQVGSERRHRMHWRLACSLHERGVPPDDAFVLLWGTAWNKHTHEGQVWTLIEKVWSR